MAGKVDDIRFDRREVIGWGPDGTVVLRGTWGGDGGVQQPVAVKRFMTRQVKFNTFEFDLYRMSENANIAQLYRVASSEKGFTYFAMELCACNLKDWLTGLYRGPSISKRTVLVQTCEALQYLHSVRVVHRNLKPTNILIGLPSGESGHVSVKLSDFGTYSTWSDTWPVRDLDCTEGWEAPEQLKIGTVLSTIVTTAADIFTLGCLFFVTLSGGHHPFGSLPYFRNQRALASQYDLTPLATNSQQRVPGSLRLIESMIQRNAVSRPSIDYILALQDFWSHDF